MSRSNLKNKWMRKKMYEQYSYMHDVTGRNPHCLDEMPKNQPSRLVATHCSNDIAWLQEPGYCQGHKTRKRGRRIVAGIVRAKLKEEVRKETNEIIQS